MQAPATTARENQQTANKTHRGKAIFLLHGRILDLIGPFCQTQTQQDLEAISNPGIEVRIVLELGKESVLILANKEASAAGQEPTISELVRQRRRRGWKRSLSAEPDQNPESFFKNRQARQNTRTFS